MILICTHLLSLFLAAEPIPPCVGGMCPAPAPAVSKTAAASCASAVVIRGEPLRSAAAAFAANHPRLHAFAVRVRARLGR
jgi:hypothetical protein